MEFTIEDVTEICDITDKSYRFYLTGKEDNIYINTDDIYEMLMDIKEEYEKLKNEYEEYKKTVYDNYVEKKQDPYLEYGISEKDFY